MSTQKQILKMKCPHCGWVRRIEIDVEIGQAQVVAGLDEFLASLSKAWREKIEPRITDRELAQPNAWLPMPPCPNPDCGQDYEYNIETRETR